jgi:hypothetical protein
MAETSGADEAEETVLVDREAEAETVIVDRADRTVVVDRDAPLGGAVSDGTGAVTRTRGRPAEAPMVPSGRRRRGIAMPPVAPGFGRGAIDAVGPGAVATYEPRAIPDAPESPAPLPGMEATRVPAPSMPSVARRTRRGGMVTLAVFAASCVVSVGGLIAIARTVFG